MLKNRISALLFLMFVTTPLLADDVQVEGVHLCCGKCVKQAKNALTGIEGISKIRVNKTDETVAFDASGKDAAQTALKSLAKAGFYGKPSIDGPAFQIDKTAKTNKISVTGMHLCCGGCVKSAVKAIESVSGVSETDVTAADGKIQISGSNISLVAVMKALHEAGMHGEVK